MPEAIRCCFFVPCLMYTCQLSLLQLLIWACSRHFYLDRLPEAIYCCLQTYTVHDVLLNNVLHVFTGFLVISTDKRQL